MQNNVEPMFQKTFGKRHRESLSGDTIDTSAMSMKTANASPHLTEINDRFQRSIPVDVEINGKIGVLISCHQESVRVYPSCVIMTPDGKQLQPTKFAQQASLGRRVVPYQAIAVTSTGETLKQVCALTFSNSSGTVLILK